MEASKVTELKSAHPKPLSKAECEALEILWLRYERDQARLQGIIWQYEQAARVFSNSEKAWNDALSRKQKQADAEGMGVKLETGEWYVPNAKKD